MNECRRREDGATKMNDRQKRQIIVGVKMAKVRREMGRKQ